MIEVIKICDFTKNDKSLNVHSPLSWQQLNWKEDFFSSKFEKDNLKDNHKKTKYHILWRLGNINIQTWLKSLLNFCGFVHPN